MPKVIIATAMNPCPCGRYNDPVKECTDSLAQVLRYQNRISGPLLNRIDIRVEVPRGNYDRLSGDRLSKSSGQIRECCRARAFYRDELAL